MMADFLIGCTHFGHKRIIDLANRPFESVEEMDETLIRNWRRVVKPDDVVYHLGDVGDPETLGKLTGRIVQIRGNHDSHKIKSTHYAEVRHNKRLLCLFHYPIEDWNEWHKGAIHLHAHTHSHAFRSAERRGNVCVEAIDYTPVRLEDAVERLIGGVE